MDCYLRDYWNPEQVYSVPFVRDIRTNERLMERAQHAIYNCDVRLFNEMEVDTGLRDVTVMFVDASGNELIHSELRTEDDRIFIVDPVVINLPARSSGFTDVTTA